MTKLKRANLSAYDKVITEYFKKLLEWNYSGSLKFVKKVYNANSIEKIINTMMDEIKKAYPNGTEESGWMPLMRAARDAWNNIKKADTDEKAIREFIALYNDTYAKSSYDYICNEIRTQLIEVESSLQISISDRKLLDSFVHPERNKTNNKISAAGMFAKPELKKPDERPDPESMKKLNARVADIEARVTVLEKKVGITMRPA